MDVRTPIPLRPDRGALARAERRSLHRALAGLVKVLDLPALPVRRVN
jgi:hypothetical protein